VEKLKKMLPPVALIAAVLALGWIVVVQTASVIFPTPLQVLAKPEVLYMDEPFPAPDALTNLRMRTELLRILQEERHTVLLITHDVEEALYLADRIVVLSPRPAVIQASFAVPQPHPRKLSSPELQLLKDAILAELGL
jgi:ABC-type nitrate/sulfonate/bicarbonate transport system ATPase subunit